MKEPRRFLRFVGKLWENMVFEPGTGWETERVEHPCGEEHKDPDYQVELLGGNDKPLVAVSAELHPGCCGFLGGTMKAWRVTAYLPVHPDGRSVVFRKGNVLLYRVELALERPTIEIRELKNEDHGRVYARWEASHKKTLSFIVGYFVGRNRAFMMANGTTEKEFTLDTARLPGGKECRIVVIATDGLRSAWCQSEPFVVREKPPELYILTPTTEKSYTADQPISLCGQVQDIGGASLSDESLVWSVDGKIVGKGNRLVAAGPFEPGSHTVTLFFVDGETKVEQVSSQFQVAARTDAQNEWQKLAARLDSLRQEKNCSLLPHQGSERRDIEGVAH